MTGVPVLQVDDVHFGYAPECPVLNAVDLRVHEAELVVLVGANGSGKSTLLRLAAGLRRPQSGRVVVRGVDVGTMDPRTRARAVAFLPQSIEPVHSLLARDVVALGRYPHRTSVWGRPSATDERAIDMALAACDASDLAARDFDTLSGGERQRVHIAGALAQGGQLLVLDEPTAALDLPHQIAVFELLRSRARAGTAVLMATHDLNLAAAYGDRLVLLDRGTVRAEGSPREVVRVDVLGDLLGTGAWIGPHPATGEPCVLPRAGRASS